MNPTHPNDDEIILEVRAIREELAAQFDYDVDRIYEEMKRREKTSKGPFVDPAPKRVERRTVERGS